MPDFMKLRRRTALRTRSALFSFGAVMAFILSGCMQSEKPLFTAIAAPANAKAFPIFFKHCISQGTPSQSCDVLYGWSTSDGRILLTTSASSYKRSEFGFEVDVRRFEGSSLLVAQVVYLMTKKPVDYLLMRDTGNGTYLVYDVDMMVMTTPGNQAFFDEQVLKGNLSRRLMPAQDYTLEYRFLSIEGLKALVLGVSSLDEANLAKVQRSGNPHLLTRLSTTEGYAAIAAAEKASDDINARLKARAEMEERIRESLNSPPAPGAMSARDLQKKMECDIDKLYRKPIQTPNFYCN